MLVSSFLLLWAIGLISSGFSLCRLRVEKFCSFIRGSGLKRSSFLFLFGGGGGLGFKVDKFCVIFSGFGVWVDAFCVASLFLRCCSEWLVLGLFL